MTTFPLDETTSPTLRRAARATGRIAQRPPLSRRSTLSPVLSPSSAPARYVLERQIGLGGMAEVFVGHLEGLAGFRRRVVIKRALSDDPSSEAVALLLEEARLAARLEHPNLVHAYDLVELDRRPCLVMEYLDGADLATIMVDAHRRGALLPFGLAAYIIAEVATGLGYAHALRDEHGAPLGVTHRDVSPSNIFLTTTGQVKLIDFGIAKHQRSTVETTPGFVRGRYAYMPPELFRARPADARADVFALGVVLNEMLTGTRCFLGETSDETVRNIVRHEGKFARALSPTLPDELLRIVEQMMTPDHELRLANGASAAEALRSFLARGIPGASSEHVRGLVRKVHQAQDFEAETTPERPALALADPEAVGEMCPRDITVVERSRWLDMRTRRFRRGSLVALAALLAAIWILGSPPPSPAEAPTRLVEPTPVAAPLSLAGPELAALVDPAPPAQEAADEDAVASPSPPAVYLTVETEPPVEVLLDGVRLGVTPLRRAAIAPGARRIELRNWKLGVYRTVKLDTAAGEPAHVSVRFQTGLVRIVAPAGWVVRSRGRELGVTPLDPLVLYEGEHALSLVDPTSGARHVRRVVVEPGGTASLVLSPAR